MSEQYVAAIDQGTTSTRCMIFNRDGRVVDVDQKEHEQIFPRAGWVEHDATEIWNNTREVVAGALAKADLNASDIAAVGITNQRETALVWDKTTGEPVYNAIVWQDTRTDAICKQLGELGGGAERYKDKVGLPLATYFSGPKVRWILDNVDGAKERAQAGNLAFGNMDTWVLWNMTGGVDGGLHITDPTNASRTMLMDLDSLSWDENIAGEMGIPVSMLPEIRSSSQVYGEVRERGTLHGVPLAGDLGDQQAATFGQACLSVGEAKNTYGTGNFMLINTGTQKVASKNGLLTTVCYKIGDQATVYALEGSIAVSGSLVQWVRDNLGLIGSAPEIETLAKTVDDSGGAYFVPAFSGLFAPYWRGDARGAIVGLTRYINKGHLARAVLEATAFQSKEVLDAMNADSGVDLTTLKVDGGMVANETLMQFQADILGVPVIRPVVAETTALGAAYAAGLAVGFWEGEDDIRANWAEDKRWEPNMDDAHREKIYRKWKKAVTKTFDWVDADD
jgi:glycerol kinase